MYVGIGCESALSIVGRHTVAYSIWTCRTSSSGAMIPQSFEFFDSLIDPMSVSAPYFNALILTSQSDGTGNITLHYIPYHSHTRSLFALQCQAPHIPHTKQPADAGAGRITLCSPASRLSQTPSRPRQRRRGTRFEFGKVE